MEGEKEERFSPEGLKCLREEVERLRERLISKGLREKWAQKRRVTVGRTPLEGCLRQLEGAQEKWEKEAAAEERIPQETLLNVLEKGLALIDRIEFLREKQKGGKKAQPPRKGNAGVVMEATQGGRGDEDQAAPLRRSQGLTGGTQEGEEQPQLPPLAAEEPHSEEEGREALEPQKSKTVAVTQQGSGGEGEDQDCEEDGSEEEDDTEEEDGSREEEDDAGSEGTQGEDSEEEGGSKCSDDDDDSDGEDRDKRGKDISARCDALWAKMNELEQEVDRRKDFPRVGDLMEKVEEFKRDFLSIQYATTDTLVDMVYNLQVILHDMMFSLQKAAFALRETISRFLPEMAALKIESDFLYDFLLVIKSYFTAQQTHYAEDHLLIKKRSLNSVLLKQVGSLKDEVDICCSAVVRHILLKQGQKKIDALQEKLGAVPNLSLEQADAWKVKIGAVQKKMGALRAAPLKEVFLLVRTVDGLANALKYSSFKEAIAMWEKAQELIILLKLGLWDVPREEVDPLWKQVNALDAVLHDIPFKKLRRLHKKQKALRGKVKTLQSNLWSSLQKMLHSPTDASVGEPVRPAEEMNMLQKNPCNPLQEKLGALQKVAAPLEEVEEVMEMIRSRFSEMEKALEAGVKEMCVSVGRITDQPASMVAKVAVPSSLEATNAQTISLNNDSEAAKNNLVAYDRQIEEDMFGQTENKSEYHELVAKKLHAIPEKLHPIFDPPSPIQGNMGHGKSPLQVSSMQPPIVPPMATTAGKAQLSLLPRGSRWSLASTSSVQLPQPPVPWCKVPPMNYPGQMSNTSSTSPGQVPDAALPGSLNTAGAQNSPLSCSPVIQPSFPWSLPSTPTGVSSSQWQTPLGMSPLQPASPAPPSTPFSSSGLCPTPLSLSDPDGPKEKGTALGQTSHGSNSSNLNAISEARAAPTSASLTALSAASPGSTGSWSPGGSRWSLASTSSVQLPQPPVPWCKVPPMNYPGQMSNTSSTSPGQVPDTALPGSLNTAGAQNSPLSCSPVIQPSFPWSLPSTPTGVSSSQWQTPLGMSPLQPASPAPPSTPFSSSGLCPTPLSLSDPDGPKEKGTALGQTSQGSNSSNLNAISEARAAPTSASLTALSAASPDSTGSWSPGHTLLSTARKTPPLRLEASEDPRGASPGSEATDLNSSKEQNLQEAMCTEFSEDWLVGCEPTLTEAGGSEPPLKKQKMDPVDRTQMTPINQELYAAAQKYITVTMYQNMEKMGDLVSRLHGPTNQASSLKDIEEAKALTSNMKKAAALLKCFFEDS